MNIAIASDHAGFAYKSQLITLLQGEGYTLLDLGTDSETPSDYPDHAADVAQAIITGKAERGILICGSAAGVCMAANKFRDIRAAACFDTYTAHQSVEHDDANVLCLGQRVTGISLAGEIALKFLGATFSGEMRHLKRLEKIRDIENKNMKD
jgi:ribose 5-phosphate isomerase B